MDTTQHDRWCRNCGAYVISDGESDWVHLATNQYLCSRPLRGHGKVAEPYDRMAITYAKEPDEETGLPVRPDNGS